MKVPTSKIRETLKHHIKKKEIMKAIKRLNESPTIKRIYDLEDILHRPVLKYIIGDIEYEGPHDVDVNSARSIYPYIVKFFDVDRMIHAAVKEFNFWEYINDQIVESMI